GGVTGEGARQTVKATPSNVAAATEPPRTNQRSSGLESPTRNGSARNQTTATSRAATQQRMSTRTRSCRNSRRRTRATCRCSVGAVWGMVRSPGGTRGASVDGLLHQYYIRRKRCGTTRIERMLPYLAVDAPRVNVV